MQNILLFTTTLLELLFTLVSGKVYTITASETSFCHSDSCLTLSQFAMNTSYYIESSTTLLLDAEEHTLDANISVLNVSEFAILPFNDTRKKYQRNPSIICSKSVSFNFIIVNRIYIKGLKLKHCNNNRFESVDDLTIESTELLDSNTPLRIIKSDANMTGIFFLSNNGMGVYRDNVRLMQNSASVGGAIFVTYSNLAVNNCHFEGNKANFGGAIFSELESNITISKSIFTSNHATCGNNGFCLGGALFIDERCTVNIKNCKFLNNTSDLDGGMAATFTATLLVFRSLFYENAAKRHGGTVTAFFNASVSVESTRAYGNKAIGDGGVVYLHESSAKINNCEFLKNSANQDGGVGYETHSSTIIVNISTFTNNSAQGSGGVLFEQNNSLAVINNCHGYSNTATSGAVFRVNVNSTLNVADSIFNENFASDDGGIAYVDNMSLISVNHCSFISNSASDTGGAVFVQNYSKMNISVSRLLSNRAIYGGALDVNAGSTAIVTACNFNGNIAINSGGAVHVYSSSKIDIKSCVFNMNSADDSGGVVYGRKHCTILISQSKIYHSSANFSGGGLYIWQNSKVWIKGSIFVKNTADFGGVVRAYVGSTVAISNSIFNENRATFEGGVLHAYRSSTIVVQNSSFAFSTARSGGVSLALWNSRLSIVHSSFSNNSAEQGGVIGLLERCTLTVLGSTFSYNVALSGGVMHAQQSSVTIKGSSSLHHNSATFFGGAIYANNHCDVIIVNCTSANNTADDGGAIVLLADSVAFLQHSYFIGNMAHDTGGVVYLHQAELKASANTFTLSTSRRGGVILASVNSKVQVADSIFIENRANVGAAMAVINSYLSFASFLLQSSNVDLIQICNNTAIKNGGGLYMSGSELSLELETKISFNLARSSGGGVYAVNSSIIVMDTVHFVSNVAGITGGGLSLANSTLYDSLKDNVVSDVNFIANQADYGGGVYVNDELSESNMCSREHPTLSGCFFQDSNNAFMINFNDNFAKFKLSSDVYGGLLDRCTIARSRNLSYNAIAHFMNISNITSSGTITSKPVKVCLCERHQVDCSKWSHSIQVKSKDSFVIQLAAVDQVNRNIPATIHSRVSAKSLTLPENQVVRRIGAICTDLSYHFVSSATEVNNEGSAVTLKLFADGPCGDKGASVLSVKVHTVACSCAPGFMVDRNISTACTCICDQQLTKYIKEIQCDSTSNHVIRKGIFWLSLTGNHSYLIFPYCPMNYCQPPTNPIPVDMNHPNGSDAQCANNHGGILCGSCQSNYSLSLGSSKCIRCHEEWRGLLVVITIAAIFAGVMLVALILTLNLTVAVGTLNPIVFYANIMYSNRNTFFRQSHFSSVFISWLNLDIGFDVCFFEGMDIYTKTWLQLVFPAYIILLVIMTILLSSCSSYFSNLIGKRNPVATLATLILISYTKFLHTVIICFSYVHPMGNIMPATRWLADASIDYFGWKHIILIGVAVVILMLWLIYTTLIFTWQWLLRCPRSQLFKWIRNHKLHSFIDTYHIPHTAKHRYWTGLLLLVRVILYLIAAFSTSVYADPRIPLISTIVVLCCLLLYKNILMIRVYKNWLINAMDSFVCFNILIPAVFTLHSFTSASLQSNVVHVSVGTTTVLLLFVTFFHVYRYGSIRLYSFCQNTVLNNRMVRQFSHIHCEKETKLTSSHDNDLDYIDSLRQDNDYAGSLHDGPTSSEVSLVNCEHSSKSLSSHYVSQDKNIEDKKIEQPQTTIHHSSCKAVNITESASANFTAKTEEISLSPFIPGQEINESIKKPLLAKD